MNSRKILYDKKLDNECYTPMYGVQPILKYAAKFKGQAIWCPFDQENSNFVLLLREQGHKIAYSHIDDGQDFFKWKPKKFDLIISNPPFQNKRLIFERALSFNIPIAFLMTMAWMNDSGPVNAFLGAGRQMQLLQFDKRIKFERGNGEAQKGITFGSGYYCADFLPNDLIQEKLGVF